MIRRAAGPWTAAVLGLAISLPAGTACADHPYCQILDRSEEPLWHAELGYVTREKVRTEGGDDFGLVEMAGGAGLVYLDTAPGTFDLRARLDTMTFIGDGDVDLPGQVGALRLDLKWTLRLPSGLSLQLSTFPGLYSDFRDVSGEDLFIPVGCSLLYAFAPQLSGIAGWVVYPGFTHVVDPRLGIRWGPNDFVLVDLFYPESRIILAPAETWRVFLGLRALLYPEYQLEKGDTRDRFMYDEWRWYGGLEFAMSETMWFLSQVGFVFNREIDFAENAPGADVDDALFLRVGVGGFL